MKKRNVMIQTAVAAAVLTLASAASAGTIATTFKTYASEVFGAGSAATAITPTPVTYQFGVPIAANQPVAVYVALSGGAKFVAGKVAAGDMVCRDSANAVITAATGAISTDSTYASFTVTPTAGFSTSNTCTYTPQAASVNNVDVALSAAGGVVNATFTIDSGAVAAGGVPTGGTNLDAGGTHTGPVAQSAAAISARYIASSAFPFTPTGGVATGTAETKKIDVAASPTTSKFTTGANTVATNRVNLGALLFTQTAGTQDDGAGADYTLAKATATGLSVVITGDFSLAEAAGASQGVFLATDLACTTQIVAPAAGAVTLNTAKTTATITGGTLPTVNVPMYVCMSIKTTNTTAIAPTAYSATASLAKTAATELANTVASTPLLATSLNGSTVTIRNYIPAAVTGYIQTVRLTNTGTVSAQPSVAVINETTGVTGTSGLIGTSLAAGATARFTQAQIEAVIGVQAATARPRLVFSAATNALEGQSFFNNASGAYTNLSGAE